MEMVIIQPVISASVKFLLDKIASSDAASFLRGKKRSGFDKLLQKLETKFLALSVLLADAEEKQIRKPEVEKWLDKLQDVVDDAKDLFDDVEYDALKRKVEGESRSRRSKVRNLFSTNFNSIDRKRKSKMEEILAKLEDFEKERYILNLEEGVRRTPSMRPPSTSLIDDSEVYGRDDEKRLLKEMLMSDQVGRGKICVIPIVGMGGIGKTTVAQAVYNDVEVNKYFQVKAWVCVSDESDVCKVTKTVLEAVTSSACPIENFNVLQGQIQEELKEKKFLIVLDDVWSEHDDFWDLLRMPFKDGAQGSKIIVTTRSEKVASMMGTVGSRRLEELKEEDCLKLFAKYATHDEDYTKNPKLERIGKEIIQKCKGLPLAVKALGGLLRSMQDEEWERIARSDILDMPNGGKNIIPALRVSYYYLPSHLKQCFAYCSMFPKDYGFKKDELVLRWMAEGLLENQMRSNMEMEDVGNEYFNDLVSRSFFQSSSVDRSYFLMHDLMVDLAKFVSRKAYFLDSKVKLNEGKLMEQARHIAYDIRDHSSHEIFESIYKATCLRTFSPLSYQDGVTWFCNKEVQVHDLLKLSCLRYLSLCGYNKLTQLPESIGELRHLRYLDLSDTKVRELPKSLSMLYNLQTLKLFKCFYLRELPENFHCLIHLRYLDVQGSGNLVMMPTQTLTSLQRLTAFYVGIKNDRGNIAGLGELPNLRGRLPIYNLQNVVKANDDARAAKLVEKKYLEELELKWSDKKANVSEQERDVLDQLLPNTTLKKLKIENYGGRTFPKWLGDNSFYNLVDLSLLQCKHCEALPPLGQLPSLKTLLIVGFDAIETIGPEFYGTSSPVVKPFPSLECLTFNSMSNWKKWSIPTENVVAFPELRTISISDCNRLTGDLPCVLPSLIKLSIHHCLDLTSSLPLMPVVIEVQLLKCKRFAGFQVDHESFSCLQNLEISGCDFEFPLHQTFKSLQQLSISNNSGSFMRSVPLESFPNIRNLQIQSCQNLESFSLCESAKYLSSLYITNCHDFTFSPDTNLRCPVLIQLQLKNCEKLKCLPDQLHNLLPSLQHLEISNCPELESSPRSQFPCSLHVLKIEKCEKFVASRKNWNFGALPKLTSFTIKGYQYGDMKSFPEQGLLPTTITHLEIEKIACLKSLDEKGFQQLNSLKELNIQFCHNLETLPEEGLPTSLEELRILICPLLEEKCKKKTGEYWNKIACIPNIRIL